MIGRVVVAWAKLEIELQRTLWAFLDVEIEEGRLITGRLDTRPKVEMLSPLAEKFLPDGKLANNLFETLGRIQELSEDRNFIVHGVWQTLLPDNLPIASSLRPKTQPNLIVAETFPPERMEDMLHDINLAHRILSAMPAELAALRGKRQKLRPQPAATHAQDRTKKSPTEPPSQPPS